LRTEDPLWSGSSVVFEGLSQSTAYNITSILKFPALVLALALPHQTYKPFNTLLSQKISRLLTVISIMQCPFKRRPFVRIIMSSWYF